MRELPPSQPSHPMEISAFALRRPKCSIKRLDATHPSIRCLTSGRLSGFLLRKRGRNEQVLKKSYGLGLLVFELCHGNDVLSQQIEKSRLRILRYDRAHRARLEKTGRDGHADQAEQIP